MSRTLTLTTPPVPAAEPSPEPLRARVATWGAPGAPPLVEVVRAEGALALVEALCDAVAERSPLPAPAVREVVENLVHAGFRDAVVSVMDAGATVRVSDHGPGIPDPTRALEPGYTTAGDDDRGVIRGVGGGLPLTAAALTALGGRLEIDENLGGGAAVTLRVPPAEAPAAPAEPACSGAAREILALLLEIGGADPARLAHELGRCRAECGRELAHLEHRGLVRRDPGGSRALTEAGTRLVATLF